MVERAVSRADSKKSPACAGLSLYVFYFTR
jgi:hypothetical protein